VRRLASLLAFVALLALPARAAGVPSASFRVDFSGSAVQRVVDTQRYVDDHDGSCFAREHIDETAHIVWTASAPKAVQRVNGSTVTGTGVRDSCDAPVEKAPADWLRQTTCNGRLELVAPPTVAIAKTRKALVLDLAAPQVAAGVGSGCALVVRSDQLVAHLGRRGIAARVQRLTADRGDVQGTILSIAAESNMGLLVMGGYGHSRLQERILGGVTRSMFECMTVPVLMSH